MDKVPGDKGLKKISGRTGFSHRGGALVTLGRNVSVDAMKLDRFIGVVREYNKYLRVPVSSLFVHNRGINKSWLVKTRMINLAGNDSLTDNQAHRVMGRAIFSEKFRHPKSKENLLKLYLLGLSNGAIQYFQGLVKNDIDVEKFFILANLAYRTAAKEFIRNFVNANLPREIKEWGKQLWLFMRDRIYAGKVLNKSVKDPFKNEKFNLKYFGQVDSVKCLTNAVLLSNFDQAREYIAGKLSRSRYGAYIDLRDVLGLNTEQTKRFQRSLERVANNSKLSSYKRLYAAHVLSQLPAPKFRAFVLSCLESRDVNIVYLALEVMKKYHYKRISFYRSDNLKILNIYLKYSRSGKKWLATQALAALQKRGAVEDVEKVLKYGLKLSGVDKAKLISNIDMSYHKGLLMWERRRTLFSLVRLFNRNSDHKVKNAALEKLSQYYWMMRSSFGWYRKEIRIVERFVKRMSENLLQYPLELQANYWRFFLHTDFDRAVDTLNQIYKKSDISLKRKIAIWIGALLPGGFAFELLASWPELHISYKQRFSPALSKIASTFILSDDCNSIVTIGIKSLMSAQKLHINRDIKDRLWRMIEMPSSYASMAMLVFLKHGIYPERFIDYLDRNIKYRPDLIFSFFNKATTCAFKRCYYIDGLVKNHGKSLVGLAQKVVRLNTERYAIEEAKQFLMVYKRFRKK
ncbi:MAG: hypothetical protein ABIE74_00965 [Pseudomonadota bacterium]